MSDAVTLAGWPRLRTKKRSRLALLTAERFPFVNHRTFAEVSETTELHALYLRGVIKPYEMMRLRELCQKAAKV